MSPVPPFDRVAIIGLGLLGGSVARAVHAHLPDALTTGFDADPAVRERAREIGLANFVPETVAEAVTGADLVVLCVPVGAMAGSTAGGIKLLRVMAVASFAHREALRHLHPNLVRPVRVGNGMLSDDVAGKVVGFILLALVIFGGGSFLIAATGPDMLTSFSASATSIGNVGPGLGDLDHGGDFLVIPPVGRWIAMGQMLLGRLEIYPVILALSVVTLRIPGVLRIGRRIRTG